MATTTKYSVITYNIGGYEIVHPVKEKSDRARYIMVTDDPDLKDESGSWEIICDTSLTGSPFDRTLQVRYNPWKYTDDKIVIKIDGSVGIEKNLDNLVDRYLKDEHDLSLMLHPTRNTLLSEYQAWVSNRGLDVEQANKVLSFLHFAEGFNVNEFKGLCQLCFMIQTRNRLNEDLNRLTYSLLKYVADDKSGIERVDQCVFSFVCQKYFPNARIMWVDQRMYNGVAGNAPFTWYPHHSDTPFRPIEPKEMGEPYWLNKKLHNAVRPQDL